MQVEGCLLIVCFDVFTLPGWACSASRAVIRPVAASRVLPSGIGSTLLAMRGSLVSCVSHCQLPMDDLVHWAVGSMLCMRSGVSISCKVQDLLPSG